MESEHYLKWAGVGALLLAGGILGNYISNLLILAGVVALFVVGAAIFGTVSYKETGETKVKRKSK